MKAIGGLAAVFVIVAATTVIARTPVATTVANADRGHDGKPVGRGSAVHIQRPRCVLGCCCSITRLRPRRAIGEKP
jgi:hypothetical protein